MVTKLYSIDSESLGKKRDLGGMHVSPREEEINFVGGLGRLLAGGEGKWDGGKECRQKLLEIEWIWKMVVKTSWDLWGWFHGGLLVIGDMESDLAINCTQVGLPVV